MWIRLKGIKYIRQSGVMTTYRPGEWVSVSSSLARRWIAEGSAEAAKIEGMARIMRDSGVVVLGNLPAAQSVLGAYEDQLGVVQAAAPRLAFARTLLWDPVIPLRLDLMAIGFGLLDTWQAAAPLLGYEPEHLAAAQGDEGERATTEAIIKDLRVPVYEPRMVFLRRCGNTRRFLEVWAEEHENGGDRHLSFHRALYRTKPRLWPLPSSWHSRG